MSDKIPSAFEIAVVAAILSMRHPQSQQPVSNCFPSAYSLLLQAAAYIPPPTGTDAHQAWLNSHPSKLFTFAEVLKEQMPPQSGKKKGRTLVGTITTRKGLIKAIRRVFPKDANEIVERQSLFRFEIQEIRRDQKRRADSRVGAVK